MVNALLSAVLRLKQFVLHSKDVVNMPFSKLITQVLSKLPGKRFGVFRLLPYFFLLGAALEFTMIKWQVGETNFYKTFKKRKAEEIALRELALEQELNNVLKTS